MARQLTLREKRMIFLLFIFVFVYIFYWFVFSSQWDQYQRAKVDLESKRQMLEKVEGSPKDLENIVKDRKNQPREEVYNKLDPGNQGTILLVIDSIANSTGVKLKSYRPLEPPKEKVEAQMVEIVADGRYDAVVSLFEILEKDPFLTQIEVQDIKPASSNSPEVNPAGNLPKDLLNEPVVVHFRVKVYSIPEKWPDRV